jgi:hypothetical protein
MAKEFLYIQNVDCEMMPLKIFVLGIIACNMRGIINVQHVSLLLFCRSTRINGLSKIFFGSTKFFFSHILYIISHLTHNLLI